MACSGVKLSHGIIQPDCFTQWITNKLITKILIKIFNIINNSATLIMLGHVAIYIFTVFPADIFQWLGFKPRLLTECDVDDLLACQPAIIAGRYELVPYKSYVEYLDALKCVQCHLRYRCLFSVRATLQYRAVVNSIRKIELTQFPGSIRKQPFGVLLLGPPGCGKSKTSFEIAARCMKTQNHILNAEEMVVLNESDQYQSEYRSSHKVVVFDDVGSSKLAVSKEDPYRKVIDFINNIPRSALNPHLELKGNVQIRPDIVMMTANKIDDVWATQQEPGAFFRRFPIKIVMLDRERAVFVKNRERGDSSPHSDENTQLSKLGYNGLDAISPISTIEEMMKDIVQIFKKHETDQADYMSKVILPSSAGISQTPLQKFINKYIRGQEELVVAQCQTDSIRTTIHKQKPDQSILISQSGMRLDYPLEGDEDSHDDDYPYHHLNQNPKATSELTEGNWKVPNLFLPNDKSHYYAFTAEQILDYKIPLYGYGQLGKWNEVKEVEASKCLNELKYELVPDIIQHPAGFLYHRCLHIIDPTYSYDRYRGPEHIRILHGEYDLLNQLLQRQAAYEFCKKLDIRNTHSDQTYGELLRALPPESLLIAKDLYVGDSLQCNLLVLLPKEKLFMLLFDDEKSDDVINNVRSKLMTKLRNTNFPHGKYALFTARFTGDSYYDVCQTNGVSKYEHPFQGALQPNAAGPDNSEYLG